jgi:hypothetical protein
MFMYWLLALGMHALVNWIDRKIAAARYLEAREASSASMTPASTTTAAPTDTGTTG